MVETVVIEKLVHGGQGLATLADGRKVFVWNALPGERVIAEIKKGRRSYAEAVATDILSPSKDRLAPKDDAYLSTSPWQIMTFAAENYAKQSILQETMAREHVVCPEPIAFHAGDQEWHYRNKMEYSFWGDDNGLHLALYNRGTHAKQIVTGSSIARPEIDEAANRLCQLLSKHGIRAGQLKTVILRCSQDGQVAAALFVKDETFPKLVFRGLCRGVAVYYSNPRSPASVLTRKLYREGQLELTDRLLGQNITYDVTSFFQVNVPVFSIAAQQINAAAAQTLEKVDMYAGVGTLGLVTGATRFVESDSHNVALAQANTAAKPEIEVIQASAESALDYIPMTGALIVDPPRAGLHSRVVARLREAKPPLVAYLSCNPATQARDLAALQDTYSIVSLEGFNFFPRTPHIESLAILASAG